jgi:hypothetical protein
VVPAEFGGNMDTPEASVGNTLYLPVNEHSESLWVTIAGLKVASRSTRPCGFCLLRRSEFCSSDPVEGSCARMACFACDSRQEYGLAVLNAERLDSG